MTTKIGTGIFITRDDQILMGYRQGKHMGGLWSIPGGRLDGGESPEQCAIREAYEECGITVAAAKPINFVTNTINGQQWITLYFQATDWHGTPTEQETAISQWQWFRWNEIPDEILPMMKSLITTGYSPFQ